MIVDYSHVHEERDGVDAEERAELNRRSTSRTGRAEDACRARVILLLGEGLAWDEVMERLGCSRGFDCGV